METSAVHVVFAEIVSGVSKVLLCMSLTPSMAVQMQTKELELKMAGIKLQDQALLVERAEVQSKKMANAFGQMQSHKSESDKLLESYNDRFTECQQSIEKSNEVCSCTVHLLVL